MKKCKLSESARKDHQTAILAAAIRAYILEQGSTSIKITEAGRNNPDYCHGMVVVHEDANKQLFISVMTEVEFEKFQREQQAKTETKE
jgi:hypothetical protein